MLHDEHKAADELDLERAWVLLRFAQTLPEPWGTVIEFVPPKPEDCYHSGRVAKDEVYPYMDFPLSKGGSTLYTSYRGELINGATRWRLNLQTIARGLRVMQQDFPDLQGREDEHTASIFLQCCLFGRMMFNP